MSVHPLLMSQCPPCLQAGLAPGDRDRWGRQRGILGRLAALPPLPPHPESPLQGPHVSPQLLLLLLFLLQLEGLHRPLDPYDGLHVVLQPVALHVGISTLDLIEHPAEAPEDMGIRAGEAGGGTLRGWSGAEGRRCLQGAQYLSHSRQGKAPWPSTLPGASGLRLGPALGLELRMDSLL